MKSTLDKPIIFANSLNKDIFPNKMLQVKGSSQNILFMWCIYYLPPHGNLWHKYQFIGQLFFEDPRLAHKDFFIFSFPSLHRPILNFNNTQEDYKRGTDRRKCE